MADSSKSALAAELQAAYERIEELEDAIREAADLLNDEDEDTDDLDSDEIEE